MRSSPGSGDAGVPVGAEAAAEFHAGCCVRARRTQAARAEAYTGEGQTRPLSRGGVSSRGTSSGEGKPGTRDDAGVTGWGSKS